MLNESSNTPKPPLKLAPDAEAPDPDRTHLDRFVHLSLLNVYGFRGQMSRRVRADVAFAGLLIIIQACIDVLAWFLGMKLVFVPGFGPAVGYPLALVFAVLFAATIAIFERSVLTADVNLRGLITNPALWFRMIFVLLASLVTAVPLELFLFSDEINRVIATDRANQVAHAQDLLRQNADSLLAALDNKLDKDLGRLEAQYAPLRKYEPPTTSSVTPRIEVLEKQIEKVTGEMQREDEGVRSGASGRGKRYKSLQGQLETLNNQLALLTTTHNAELVDLRKEARSRAEAGELAYQQAVNTLHAEHEKQRAALLTQRDEIEGLPVPVLAAKARVNIDVAEGFSARVRILHSLAKQEYTVQWGIWALRLVMVLFGLLVLIQKATFSTETRAYFSAMAMAAQGDTRLQKMFGSLTRLRELSERDREAMGAVTDEPKRD
jgi:hypothetical protein